MWRRVLGPEEGQSLIQFAVALVILLGFVALAVDVGNYYAERRKMQNAADAGALAGAREMCIGNGNSAAVNSARAYLSRNGVPSTSMSDITIAGNKISVTAHETANTMLAGVLDLASTSRIKQFDVSASAKAVCGAANSACGLWPIAFDKSVFSKVACGQSLVIWDADNDNQQVSCEIGGVPRDICSCYDCDLDDDGSNDFTVMTDVARGWMDFPGSSDPVYTDSCNANGCGAAELKCRLEDNYGGRVKLPACIPGLRGVKAGAKAAVDARKGQLVEVPLFSAINCGSDSNCSGTDARTYFVDSFGCVSVTGWVQNFVLNPKPGMPKTYKKITTKTILVTKDCSQQCMTACGAASDTVAQPWELRAVSLSQ